MKKNQSANVSAQTESASAPIEVKATWQSKAIAVLKDFASRIVSFQSWDSSNPSQALFQVRIIASSFGKRIGNIDVGKDSQHVYLKDMMSVTVFKELIDMKAEDIDSDMALFAILSIIDGSLISKKTAESCRLISANYESIADIIAELKITCSRFNGHDELILYPKEYYTAIAQSASTLYALDAQSAKLRSNKKGNAFKKQS